MALDRFFLVILFFLWTSFASSSFISDGAFDSCGSSTGRSLLQNKKNCPVNFEFQNYTIITSQCKGPHYSQNACCTAFKEFACPFADELNDVSNDCASTMFSYINLNGRYPPGLFASFCREGKEGLACPASAPLADDTNANAGQKLENLSALLIILAAGFMLFHIF
ncbi:GPI-anchored protein LLG1 [Cinnamomum micranthum f. kanehirae]|uniref:GPI-anchored protein LLG1 n=1 Tax=Cinnamomum micranthum f. kanehirae TaxID=337451 RepID=A0A3S3NDK0_9MAGN|nr:GPI-anchored protein LLG1 [Cinnamomum micranthum f. kanehirae]